MNQFENTVGPATHRVAVAIAVMELQDPWVTTIMREFSAEEQPVFLAAYQCFIVWTIRQGLVMQLPSAEIISLTERIRSAFASAGQYDSATYEKIWPVMREILPIGLQAKGQTGVAYPLAVIIQAANSAGFDLHQVMDYRLGIHPMLVINRIWDTFPPN